MANSTSNTPELLQTQVAKVLVQPLEQQSLFLSSGVTIYDTSSPIRVPKMGGPTDVEWVGEAEEIPDDETVEFDEVTLLPSTMKSIKTIVKASNEMFRQSVISLDAAMQNRIVTDVSASLDTQLFSASGDGITKPKGLFAYSGVQSVAVGGQITLDALLDAWGKALTAHVNMSSLKWVMQGREFIKLRKLKDADNRYMLQPDPTVAGGFTLFGIPVLITNRIPDTTGGSPTARAALVDFSQIAVARDLAPSITILRERYAEFDQVGIRVITRYDAAPLNPQSIVVLNGITI